MCSWQMSSMAPLGLKVSLQLLLGTGESVLPCTQSCHHVFSFRAQYDMRLAKIILCIIW